MRILVAAVGLVLLLLTPVLAAPKVPVFDTPKALLEFAYAPYATGKFADDTNLLYSSDLNAQFAAAEANTPADDVGPVDFDVFVNGQDYQLSELKIGDPAPEGEGVSVPVTFKNFNDPQSLVYHLVREGGGWKINDIESLTPGSTWRLTTLLAPDDSGSGDSSGQDGDGSDQGGGDDAPTPPQGQ
ncbi:MAG TPA: DUF3828 domain-containing protein [Devosiaceae bacterium]|nr:DUF3828 domain-containing protein [Devosiaceae bacterium]